MVRGGEHRALRAELLLQDSNAGINPSAAVRRASSSSLCESPPLFFQISPPAAASQNPFTVALSQNPVNVVAVFTRHRCCSRTAGASRRRHSVSSAVSSKSVALSPFSERHHFRRSASLSFSERCSSSSPMK
ncbi:hypothetical protein AAHE18_16G027700 [Arachis hypogaea]